MAVIQFTAADALQTTIIPASIYPSEVTKLQGPVKSSTGKSVNYILDIAVTDGKYKGKSRTIIFNSESSNVNMLGDMQFFPQAYFLSLDSAISGREIKPEDYNLDTDSLLHKPFDCDWGVATVDGHLVNVINGFHPKGYGAQTPAF